MVFMTKSGEAVACFKGGFSCTQALLSTFSEELGMDRKNACKVASGFGGGVGRTGNICGAVSGAIMVIGLKYGKATPENCAERERTYELVREFVREYTALHGSVNCTDLLGYDLSDPAAHAEAQEKRIAGQKCPKYVEDAVQILEKIIKAHP
jgi:C_GCAxxG_C_C family probable redox protein